MFSDERYAKRHAFHYLINSSSSGNVFVVADKVDRRFMRSFSSIPLARKDLKKLPKQIYSLNHTKFVCQSIKFPVTKSLLIRPSHKRKLRDLQIIFVPYQHTR